MSSNSNRTPQPTDVRFVRASVPNRLIADLLPLSSIDNVFKPFFIVNYFVYENVSQTLHFMHPKRLRESLSETLNEFPELAGSCVPTGDKQLNWALKTDNKGVKWMQNSASISLKYLKHHEFAQEALPEEMIVDLMVDAEQYTRPLVIKHTTLTDGSVLLTLAINHAVSDAYSIFNLFMPKWIAYYHGTASKLTKQPLTDRTVLVGDPKGPQDANGWHDNNSPLFNAVDLTYNFNISAEQLDRLKGDIQEKIGHKFKVTRNDAICALVWVVNTEILHQQPPPAGASAEHLEYTGFEQILNGRRALNLPDNYFGNAIFSVFARAKQADLLGAHGLAVGAEALHNSVQNAKPEQLRGWLNWIADDKQPAKFRRPSAVADKGCISTNILNMGYHDVDFGFGQPIHFGMAQKEFRRSFFSIYASQDKSKTKGGAHIINGLPKEHQKLFWAHPLVKHYVTGKEDFAKL